MADMLRMKFTQNITKRLKLLETKLSINKSTGIDFKAKQKIALQLLNWSINGSSNESVVPPILTGQLRGSGTVFVGNKHVGDAKNKYPDGTPAGSYDGKPDTITIGFNTAYAARMHESNWTPGGQKPSRVAQNIPGLTGDVGNKFIQKHLQADGKALVQMYAILLKKELL